MELYRSWRVPIVKKEIEDSFFSNFDYLITLTDHSDACIFRSGDFLPIYIPGRKGPHEYAKIGRLRGSPRSNARLRE